MVDYKKLGYKNIEEYNIEFLDTLLNTNRTYEYFVDWKKVFSKLEDKIVEISILNALSKIQTENVEEKFREILNKYPECVPLLPTILAIRDIKFDVFDSEKKNK